MIAAQPKGIIRLYKMRTLALIKVIHIDTFKDSAICGLHNHPKDPSGQLVITGDRHETVVIYSITDEKVTKNITARGYTGSVSCKKVTSIR